MKIDCYKKSSSNASPKGYTFAETVVAIGMSGIIFVTIMVLFSALIREQRIGFIRQRVFEKADRIQDEVTELLQSASKEAGVFFTDANGAFYRTIIFRTATGGANQRLQYDPTKRSLTYTPDITVSGGQRLIGVLGKPKNPSSPDDPTCSILDVSFRTAMQTGGIPDSSVILVNVTVSDQGYATRHYKDPSKVKNHIISTRSFAVNTRRN
ncbi:MAG TPA: hypothetical protein PKW18_06140 [Candidatus Sumerlaeota bacterium]|nr:hypothetical protein [Candidatus Sumerlaeota bacterium]HON50170.1 hypothetical protein [Candidatus Sumerlaeota bacterium]HOR63386.1 hypothetical protein [Candidatus Sumerlaeota bacterium]HPL74137.1 hypothetical protein [Candidatus Sumerlaeota bacterium]HRR31011.1 hypothetical protein [Candidatus Sumerlaeia bacterium]